MNCIRCASRRILTANAHCKDLGYFEINGASHDGYVPDDLGIGGGDGVDILLCLDCGQLQGVWPLPQSKLERKATKRDTPPAPSQFAQSIVDHVISTNDGNVGAVIALMMEGWLTSTGDEIVQRVAECIQALTVDPRTNAMGMQLIEVLQAWEHWCKLEPLISEDGDEDEESY
jgi:hypothetical protein